MRSRTFKALAAVKTLGEEKRGLVTDEEFRQLAATVAR